MLTLHRVAAPLLAVAHYAPTRRLAAVVLLASPLWLLSRTSGGQIAISIVLAAIVLAALSDALRIPGSSAISIQRLTPGALGLGDTRDASYQVASSWPNRLRATISHRVPSDIVAPLGSAALVLDPRSTTSVIFQITGQSRGVHQLGSVAVTVYGPWRLIRRSLVYSLTDTISVVPATPAAGRYRLLAAQHRVRAAGQRLLRRRGAGTAFASLRDYTPGDDPRHIDWKATARRNHLVSREFSVEQGQTVIIAVDAGRMMTQRSGNEPRFEWALSSALTLADVALSGGDRVGLIVFDSVVRRYLQPARGPGTIGAIREALVGVTATITEPDYAAAFRTLAERTRRRSLIVLFTDVVDPRSSRTLIALTARSAARHVPLVVALRNEELMSAAVPRIEHNEQSYYASAAAEELLSARAEALQSMRQAGVAVLDTSPQSMTTALINRYLEIKERSEL